MAGIEGYNHSEHTKKLHAERSEKSSELRQLEEESKDLERRRNGGGEAEVVLGSQLAEVLQEWQQLWFKERDPNLSRSSEWGMSYEDRVMGPNDWLTEKTGLNERRIAGFIKGEFKTVPLTQAELVLLAIDKYYLLDNGTIRIIPNPNWSLEKWMDYMKERGCI